MIRIWALALILAVGLVGCGDGAGASEENREPTQITVQSGLVSFEEQTISVESSELVGTWADPENDTVLILSQDGQMTMTDSDGTTHQVDWQLGEDGLTITDDRGEPVQYKTVERDGEIRILGPGSEMSQVEENESLLSQEVNYLGLGEAAETALLRVTLTSIEFAPRVSLERSDYLLPHPEGGLAAQEGNLLACIAFRVRNLSGGSVSQDSYCTMQLEYDNAYTYGSGYYGNITDGQTTVPSATVAEYRCAIECPQMAAEETDTPLSIRLTLPDTDGTVEFIYVLK